MDSTIAVSTRAPTEIVDAVSPKTRRSTKAQQHPDRIKINPEALRRVSNWIEQASSKLRGVRLTRSDLVSFLILQRPEQLSEAEMLELEKKHFDEMKFTLWAIAEVKAAQARGESVSLVEFMFRNRPNSDQVQVPRIRKPRTKKLTENTDKNAENS